jgi:hypothetical protein
MRIASSKFILSMMHSKMLFIAKILMRGLVVFGIHLIGETVFWLKSLYQLGFVRFFGFYFWIGVIV